MAFCQSLPVGTTASSHTTWRSTEADHDGAPASSVGSVFRTFECVSAGRHPLLPEWSQQATVCVHGDAEQCVGAYKANIVSLSTLAYLVILTSWALVLGALQNQEWGSVQGIVSAALVS